MGVGHSGAGWSDNPQQTGFPVISGLKGDHAQQGQCREKSSQGGRQDAAGQEALGLIPSQAGIWIFMSSEATFLQGGWAVLTRIEGVKHLYLQPSSSISRYSSYTPESAKDEHAFNGGYGRAVPNSKQSTKVTAEGRGGPQGEGGKDLAFCFTRGYTIEVCNAP